jgi:surfeit locus 1 family protein
VERQVQRAEELRFYRVVARGHYETDHQILIDNRVHQGRVGYHVITPLRLENSEVRLLVNRGWIAIGESRDRLPAIDTPGGLQQITGVATVPAEKYFTLAKPQPGWQRVWQNMEMMRYTAAVPFPVQPVVVLLDPDSTAGGFTRDWSRLDAGISVHQGYAFQWFMLAAALASIYLFMSLRRRGAGQPEQEKS